MSNQSAKIDPIRDKFFRPLERAEQLSGVIVLSMQFDTVSLESPSHRGFPLQLPGLYVR
jgi:hypothetical protein